MIKIAHASISENGSVNGSAGDQTGKEVCIRDWYNKPWGHVIRFKDKIMAERLAYDMEAAARNDKIGYSQKERNTLLLASRKTGYDVSKITDNVNCDCSSLVSVACIYAGVNEGTLYNYGNCATTSTLRSALMKTGLIEVFSDSSHTKETSNLKRGDILLSEGHHVAVVISEETPNNKPVSPDIVQEVLDGKFGNGRTRESRLKDLGYNPVEVQRKVNEVITCTEALFHIKKELGDYWKVALTQLR